MRRLRRIEVLDGRKDPAEWYWIEVVELSRSIRVESIRDGRRQCYFRASPRDVDLVMLKLEEHMRELERDSRWARDYSS
jgi:hypothetical protein